MNLLLLCDYLPNGAQTVIDHIEALGGMPGHDVSVIPVLGDLPAALDLGRFDGVILHYSLVISNDNYLSQAARRHISAYRGLKAVFIQDEYRWVDRTVQTLRELGVHVLFTCVPQEARESVYPIGKLPGIRIETVLTGYVPASLLLRPRKPYMERTIDVGYRARRLSAFYGRMARDKWLIAEKFRKQSRPYKLKLDLSCREHRRLYGEKWLDFLGDCKAVLGVESGAGVFDFSGEIQPAVEEYEKLHPRARFEEIEARFFPGLDGRIRLNQISPRCFEAAAMQTLMVLYEGEYSGVLQPWRHYVPLRKDQSNIAEVVDVLRSEASWAQITDAAYEEIAKSERWGYHAFAHYVSGVLNEEFANRTDLARATSHYARRETDAMAAAQRKVVTYLHAERDKYGTWPWRMAAAFAARGPRWLVQPARAVWRAHRSSTNQQA